jgi:transcriptional regulator with XRE-family HTH domain
MLAPADVGTALREAREQLGASLAEVRDRTGVSFEHLEALEAMDFARLPDQRTVVTAARRYSEVVGLDPSEICGTTLRSWQDQHLNAVATQVEGPARSGRQRRRQADPATPKTRGSTRSSARASKEKKGPSTGGLADHHTGTEPHLRSFTQTAEVPLARGQSGRGGASLLHFADTGSIPVTSRGYSTEHWTPLWLRVTVLVTAVLLLIGVAGLAIHHYEPKWLVEIHVTRQTAEQPTTGPATTSHRGTSRSSTAKSNSVVTQTAIGRGAASATVHVHNYQVVIVAQKSCWIDATAPSSSSPLFVGVLQPGETKSLSPVDGRLSVEFGASFVTVGVEVNGKVAPGWLFAPPTVPFTLSFVPPAGN